MQPIAEDAAARIVLWTVVAAYLSMVPVMALSGIWLDLPSTANLASIVGFVVPFMLYVHWRRMKVLPTALNCVAAVFAFALPILVWTYAAMRVNMPLADAGLVAMDAALGFDWHGFIAFVDARPLLAGALAASYASFPFQLLLLPLLLALAGHPARAYAMFFAYVLVCLVSAVVSIWYPALGTYVVYGVAQGDLASINAKFGFYFLEQFHAVRAEGPFTLAVDRSAGIVTFPSVHAASAALCAWAAWPVRLLRYPALVLNGAMAVSAVSHANHYLIDVVAGFGITGLCIAAAVPVFYRQAQRRSPVLAAAAGLVRPSQPAPAAN